MNGRLFKGILLLLVLMMACFMASPISSGEHPWGSDRGGGDDAEDTLNLNPEDTTTDSSVVLVDDGATDAVPAWLIVFTRTWTSVSAVF